uniref:Uncharacterized protein n=1 Tax=Manihot esculenta TaxID=3983 RepID=A0A199UC30_MANES
MKGEIKRFTTGRSLHTIVHGNLGVDWTKGCLPPGVIGKWIMTLRYSVH